MWNTGYWILSATAGLAADCNPAYEVSITSVLSKCPVSITGDAAVL